MVNNEIRLIIFLAAKDVEALQSQQKRPGADCGSHNELLIARFRLKLKKVGKSITPFSSSVQSLSCVQLFAPPMEYTIHGILQARMLEWIAFPFSRGTFQPRDQTQVLCIVEQFLYQLSHSGSDK